MPKGQTPWNEGLTKDTDPRVAKISQSHMGRLNPMFGKHWTEEAKRRRRVKTLGHTVTVETRKKIGQKHKGKTISAEMRQLLSLKSRWYWANLSPIEREKRRVFMKNMANLPSTKEKLRQARKGKKASPETRRRLSLVGRGHKMSLATRKRISVALKKAWLSPELRGKQSEIAYHNWANPEYAKKVLGKRYARPNKKETALGLLLDEMASGVFRYVGNGDVSIGRLNPDYVGEGKVVELYGDYWHRGQNPQDRVDRYAGCGYQCLVVWEHELKDIEVIIARIREFVNASSKGFEGEPRGYQGGQGETRG